MKNSKESLWELEDTIKIKNIHIMEISEEEEKEIESIFKAITAEYIPNLKREIYIQVQEA